MLAEQRNQLKLILGPRFNESYCDFLTYVDPTELDLSKSIYVGGGSYGKVFRVSWRNKPTRNLDFVKEAPGDVALKLVSLRHGNTETVRAKFFIEVGCSMPIVSPCKEHHIGLGPDYSS